MNIVKVGDLSRADADVNISHTAKHQHQHQHPIVAQYLGIGLDDADRFERQATTPLTTNKQRPHATPVSAIPTGKQVKETGKKRSASAPHPKPPKKTKRSQSDDGYATASASKTTTRSKKKSTSAPFTEGNKKNAVPPDPGSQREPLPSNSFALPEQTAQKLNAWRFESSPSTSSIIETTSQPDSNTDHQIDSQSWLTSSAITPVQKPVHASSTVDSESIASHPADLRSSFTSSTVTPATPKFTSASASVRITPAKTPQSVRISSPENISSLSPKTSLEIITDTEGHGHSIYGNASHLFSSNRLITSKPHPESQPALTPPRPPPTNGCHVLETIFEESPPSSIERVRELPGTAPESSPAPICGSTEPISTGAVDLNDFFDEDVFDDLDDGDLLDLELSSEATAPASRQVPRNSLPTSQAVQPVSPVVCRNVDPDIIDLVSDDEWNILEDEEVAFLVLTDDAAHTARPISIAKIRDKSRLKPAKISVADSDHDTSMAQLQSITSPQEQVSPQLPTITAAEATDDYLNAILHPPIIRPPFPKPIRDRSSLIGVSASLVLKTCFRVGECLNVGCTFARNSNTQSSDTILIELYAKVISSHRDPNGVTQHFVLADLFHEKRGPFLDATCETWKGSELWEYDCGRFLCTDSNGEKKICRAVGRMKREGGKWRFVVLNIWEATWEDVEFVRGIICGV